MKVITTNENKEKELNIGYSDSVRIGINTNKLEKLAKVLSNNLYSDPISSIIREITSNCYDANLENNISELILINTYRDIEDGEIYISFTDKGKGMTEDFLYNNYMMLLDSSKDTSDNFIGGWGLGSKSPLSYQDFYFIDTIVDNIEYKYVVNKEIYENEYVPVITKLSENPSIIKSGTTIRVQIKESDNYEFYTKLQKQLAYFSGIYIKNSFYYAYNNQKIIEGNTFKFNTLNPPSTDLHICYNQVYYPINFSVLKIPTITSCCFALKFDINELDVTLSRENIQYTPKSIQNILKKIDDFKMEILELYKLQFKDTKVSLKEYLKTYDKEKIFILKSDDTTSHEIHIKSILDVKSYSTLFDIPKDFNDYLNINKLEYSSYYHIIKTILNCLYKVHRVINGKIVETQKNNSSLIHLIENGNYYIFTEFPSIEICAYLKDFNFIIYKYNYNDIVYAINSIDNTVYPSFTKRIFTKNDFLNISVSKEDRKKAIIRYTHLNKAKLYKLLFTQIKEKIEESKLKIPSISEEWYNDYLENLKRIQKENYLYRKTKIYYLDIENVKQTKTLEDLRKYTYIIYKIIDKESNISSIRNEMKCQKLLFKRYSKKILVTFILLNQTNYSKIRKLKNLLPIENVIKLPLFKNTIKRLILYRRYKDIVNSSYIQMSNKYNNLVNYIREYFIKHDIQNLTYNIQNSNYEYITNLIYKLDLTKNKKIILNIIEDKIFELKELDIHFDILKHILNIPKRYQIKIIKQFKIRYLKDTYYEDKTNWTERDDNS